MRDEDECGLDLLGTDALVGKSAAQMRYEADMQEYKQQTAKYNTAADAYWKKNPDATDADIARFQKSWRRVLDASPPVAPVGFAAKSCGANGMTVWHWLFLLFLLICALVMPHVIAYLRSRRAKAQEVPAMPAEPQAQE